MTNYKKILVKIIAKISNKSKSMHSKRWFIKYYVCLLILVLDSKNTTDSLLIYSYQWKNKPKSIIP